MTASRSPRRTASRRSSAGARATPWARSSCPTWRSFAAPDAKTIRMTLKEPYGLVIQTLAKPGANVPFMMPKRVAETDPQQADHRLRRLRSLHLQAGRMAARREGRLPEEPEIQAAQPSRPRDLPAARSPRSIASSGSGSRTRRRRSTRCSMARSTSSKRRRTTSCRCSPPTRTSSCSSAIRRAARTRSASTCCTSRSTTRRCARRSPMR